MAKGEKFKAFINRVGEVFPEILGATAKLASGNLQGAISDVAMILGANTNHENQDAAIAAQTLLKEFELKRSEFELEYFKEEIKDVQNARDNETSRDISENTGFLTKNIHEIIALFIIGTWIFTWFYKPIISYPEITGVVTLILGYLYGRTKPQK